MANCPMEPAMSPDATRLIEVDFPYDASVIYKGFRNPRLSQFLGRRTVAVREVDPSVLKPALEVVGSYARHMETDLRIEAPIAIYSFDGGLWTVLTDDAGRPVSSDAFSAGATHHAHFRHGNPFDLDRPQLNVADPAFGGFRVSAKSDFPEITIDQVGLRKVVSSRLTEAAADAQRVADSLLFAGGLTMYRCHEPFWSAHPHRNEACLVFGPEDSGGDHVRMETFRADRREDMIAWRQRWAESQGGSPQLTDVRGEVRILDPTALRRQDLKYLSLGMTNIAQETYCFFREAGATALLHWAALRDRTRQLSEQWSAELAMSSIDALAGVRASFLGLPVRGPDYSKNSFTLEYTKCRRVMARAQWFEGWVNSADVELSVDDEAAIDAIDDWQPAAAGGM